MAARIRGAPGDAPQQIQTGTEEPDLFQVITEDDRHKADEEMVRELLHYAGYTLLGVLLFLIIIGCFASDPRACVVAFGTGSPCCLLCPCIKSLYKYTNPSKLIQDSANTYVPGVLIEDDGTVTAYEPSPEETQTLYELINEFMSIS
ncbi:uncharacterized protein LOC101854629 [Aplysia californica]|uniref:Uncharacterized protein LOC101854629 n=1 Tax=Aplysia californica TaxID=6500 RepID=A0ABM0JJG8_APLCA|nr:uncharacterized protein LOC101854629 [Aplysia californica]